jgi:hypothetical protein
VGKQAFLEAERGVNMKTIGWMSGGVSSLLACLLAKDLIDQFVYIDIPDQHPDTYRFLSDAEKLLGRKITTITAGKTIEEICYQYAFIRNVYGYAKCTMALKINVRKAFEKEVGATRNVWGFDANETKRIERAKERSLEDLFPLFDKNLNKANVHFLIKEKGIKLPWMYAKYKNNNCIGCIKGGKGYWNQIRKDFPDVFAARAAMERKIGATIINGVYLDELDPKAGRNEPITAECSIYCQIERIEYETL